MNECDTFSLFELFIVCLTDISYLEFFFQDTKRRETNKKCETTASTGFIGEKEVKMINFYGISFDSSPILTDLPTQFNWLMNNL